MAISEILDTVRKYQELKRFMEQIKDEQTALEEIIKAEMTARDTSDLTAGEYRIKWTPYTTTRVDTAKLKKDLPDIAERYSTTTQARRFTVN